MTEPTLSCTRRRLLAAAAAIPVAGLGARLAAETPSIQMPSGEALRLWPGRPPGAGSSLPTLSVEDHSRTPGHPDRGLHGVADPWVEVHRPLRPNGAAMLVVPGGGYVYNAYDKEGTRQAEWLNDRGITAFVLGYRLPAEGWNDRRNVPLQDAQRAMRLIRRGASGYGIDPDRLGVLGFSAGGHLAGSLATRWDERVYAPVDAADTLSARPAIAALCYPVITMSAPFTHGGSHDALLGANASADLVRRYSVDQRVSAQTPPCFIVQAQDDDVVPVQNSLMMYEAMLAAKRPVAMHLFVHGGHGFGIELPRSEPASAWPALLANFAAAQGMIDQQG